MRINTKKKGSILAYTIVIMAIMFAVAGSISSVAVLEKKSASSSQSSSQAYQVADSGAQAAIQKINAVLTSSDNRLSDAFAGCVEDALSGKAVVSNVVGADSIPYELTFYQEDNVTPISKCSESVTSVKNIKSVGSYKGTARAVTVSVGSSDSFTKLLLHADGQNNSETFLDSSFYEKQITSVNGANIATNKKYFGSASASFDGTNDYLEVQNSTDWNFGSGDFTIEFWMLNSSKNSRQHAFSFGNSLENLNFDFNDPDSCQGSPKGIWVYWNSSGGNAICTGTTNEYTDGDWHHIALVRKSNVMKLYVDGVSVGSSNYSDPINLSQANGSYMIGAVGSGIPQYFWKGNIDELRISKGIARWDANFTVPDAPY